MITLIAVGVGLLVLIGAFVRVMEAARAPAWRHVAAQRRARWEARQHETSSPTQRATISRTGLLVVRPIPEPHRAGHSGARR
jgi:hypothetical protein